MDMVDMVVEVVGCWWFFLLFVFLFFFLNIVNWNILSHRSIVRNAVRGLLLSLSIVRSSPA